MISIEQIREAFLFMHESMADYDFSKTMSFNWWTEKDILPNVRFFLLGYFGAIEPEVKTELRGNYSEEGFIDFVVDNVAIEFAVRKPDDYASKLTSYSNRDERKKLVRRKQYNESFVYGVLVLFDFSDDPLNDEQLEDYREQPPLGRGNFNLDNFSVLYFYRDNGESKCIRKNILF